VDGLLINGYWGITLGGETEKKKARGKMGNIKEKRGRNTIGTGGERQFNAPSSQVHPKKKKKVK